MLWSILFLIYYEFFKFVKFNEKRQLKMMLIERFYMFVVVIEEGSINGNDRNQIAKTTVKHPTQ